MYPLGMTGTFVPFAPVTVTLKSTPASAELLTAPVPLPDCFEFTETSVRRPITAEGLTTKMLPAPLDVLIPATACPLQVPLAAVQVLLPEESIVQLSWHCSVPDMTPFWSIEQATSF